MDVATLLRQRAQSHPVLQPRRPRVFLVDERYSTNAAEALTVDPYERRRNAFKDNVDSLAACLLVEQFLRDEDDGMPLEEVL
mmetsp:Transcript_1762/g.7680  ORF Transcript_1762/g.7680 Transcript_1762/m.7680 type:complete len:82 (+) Transcript_1762:120-365(+)|eukprot:scaffold845_cov231-Pinguiococcus_pyrenoidosus.AAC.14